MESVGQRAGAGGHGEPDARRRRQQELVEWRMRAVSAVEGGSPARVA